MVPLKGLEKAWFLKMLRLTEKKKTNIKMPCRKLGKRKIRRFLIRQEGDSPKC